MTSKIAFQWKMSTGAPYCGCGVSLLSTRIRDKSKSIRAPFAWKILELIILNALFCFNSLCWASKDSKSIRQANFKCYRNRPNYVLVLHQVTRKNCAKLTPIDLISHISSEATFDSNRFKNDLFYRRKNNENLKKKHLVWNPISGRICLGLISTRQHLFGI